jgi:hypothetical protein
MGYSPEDSQELINQEEQRLLKEAGICRAVKESVESDGWKNTLGPLLDRMIIDVLGGKIGDVWVAGKIDRAKKEERREFHIGYKQALIDWHSRVMFHLQQLPMLEDRIKSLQEEKKVRYRVPMVDDGGRYQELEG